MGKWSRLASTGLFWAADHPPEVPVPAVRLLRRTGAAAAGRNFSAPRRGLGLAVVLLCIEFCIDFQNLNLNPRPCGRGCSFSSGAPSFAVFALLSRLAAACSAI